MQINTGKELVEATTGEVITHHNDIVDVILPGRTDYIGSIFSGSARKPIHIQKAQELGIDAKTLQSYVGVMPVKASEGYYNKPLTIIGACAWFSGAFMRNDGSDAWSEGYTTVLLKISDTRERKIIKEDDSVLRWKENIIIKTSGKGVAEFVAQLMEGYGWFDFPLGMSVNVIIFEGSDGKQYIQSVPEE